MTGSLTEALKPGRTAVITGAGLGIGRAAAIKLAAMDLRLVLIDTSEDDLVDLVEEIGRRDQVTTAVLDVADRRAMEGIAERCSDVAFLMNNAVSRLGKGGPFTDKDDWRTAIDVNFWGVVNGVDAFAPAMIEAGQPAYIVNVGSKQGITNPPGNTVYNITKSAVKTYTEALQHDLRGRGGCRVSAHLLIPGWTATGRTAPKPGAWLPGQVVDRMLEGIGRGSFYILCPDNEVTEEMDRKRILWSAGDITEDRPPLSRWEGSYGQAFDSFEP